MNWINIDLSNSALGSENLNEKVALAYKELCYSLEDKFNLKTNEKWESVKPDLSSLIQKNVDINKVTGSTQLFLHTNNEQVLSMPWEEVELGVGQEIINTPTINIAYGRKPILNDKVIEPVSLPLRILILISDPVDLNFKKRLNYEKEELAIREALFTLEEKGILEIETLSNGSMEALVSELDTRPYHIIHYIGHSNYLQGQATLHLEHPVTFYGTDITAQSFVQSILNTKYGKALKLMFLGSCRSAKSKEEAGESLGLAQQVIEAGIPASIGMIMKIQDDAAITFSSAFYANLAQGDYLSEAVKKAKITLGKKLSQNQQNPQQRNIPKLYIGKRIEKLFDLDKKMMGWSENHQRKELIQIAGFPTDQQLSLNGMIFWGRRREVQQSLSTLRKGKQIIISGFKGVGKTALGIHCAERLVSTHKAIYIDLKFLKENYSLEQLLTSRMASVSEETTKEKPLLIFDNYRFLLINAKAKQYKKQFHEQVNSFIEDGKFQVIIISQFPTDFSKQSNFSEIVVKHPSLNAYRQKIGELCKKSHSNKSAYQIVYKIEKWTCSNYGLLAQLFGKVEAQRNTLFNALADEIENKKRILEFSLSGYVSHLVNSLEINAKKTLFYLAYFSCPVSKRVLETQSHLSNNDLVGTLKTLNELGLCEKIYDRLQEDTMWYVPTIIMHYLEAVDNMNKGEFSEGFDFDSAGFYLLSLFRKSKDVTHLNALIGFAFKSSKNDLLIEIAPFWIDHLFATQNSAIVFKRGKQVYERLGNQTPLILLNRLAINFRMFKKYKESEHFYLKGIETASNLNDDEMFLTMKSNYAKLLSSTGRFSEAFQLANETLKLANSEQNKGVIATLYQTLSYIKLEGKADLNEALKYTQLAQQIFVQLGDWASAAACYVTEIEVLLRTNQMGEAEALIDKSLEYASLGKDHETFWRIKFYQAKFLKLRREDQAAIKVLEDILKYTNNSNSLFEKEVIRLLNVIENTFDEIEIEDQLAALEKLEIRENYNELLKSVNDLANFYLTNETPQKAENIISRWAMPHFDMVLNLELKGYTLNNLAMAYQYLGHLPKSISLLEEAYGLIEQSENKKVKACVTENLGKAYTSIGLRSKGIPYLDNALIFYEEIGDKNKYNDLLTYIKSLYRDL